MLLKRDIRITATVKHIFQPKFTTTVLTPPLRNEKFTISKGKVDGKITKDSTVIFFKKTAVRED